MKDVLTEYSGKDPNQLIQHSDIFNNEDYHNWFCDTFGYDADTITCMEWVYE
jgi:hypothetical protein